jgi:hypothetical protein
VTYTVILTVSPVADIPVVMMHRSALRDVVYTHASMQNAFPSRANNHPASAFAVPIARYGVVAELDPRLRDLP